MCNKNVAVEMSGEFRAEQPGGAFHKILYNYLCILIIIMAQTYCHSLVWIMWDNMTSEFYSRFK